MSRLTEHKNKNGDVTSVLAFDDITGTKLDASKVIEARTKEIHYVRDMRMYDKIPRAQAARKGWKIIKTRWVDITRAMTITPTIAVGSSARSSTLDR